MSAQTLDIMYKSQLKQIRGFSIPQNTNVLLYLREFSLILDGQLAGWLKNVLYLNLYVDPTQESRFEKAAHNITIKPSTFWAVIGSYSSEVTPQFSTSHQNCSTIHMDGLAVGRFLVWQFWGVTSFHFDIIVFSVQNHLFYSQTVIVNMDFNHGTYFELGKSPNI